MKTANNSVLKATVNGQGQTIFVQDDIPINTLLCKKLWEKEGYRVVTCNDINKAFQMIIMTRPDLIFCDILEPEHNGYEFCSFLKSSELTKNIPFCFLTSLDGHKDYIRGLKAGTNGYVTKPATFYNMPDYISRLMRSAGNCYVPRLDNPWSIHKVIPEDRRCERNYFCSTICDALLQIEKEKPETWADRIWQMLDSSGYFQDEMLVEDGRPLALCAPFIEFTIDNERLYNDFKETVHLFLSEKGTLNITEVCRIYDTLPDYGKFIDLGSDVVLFRNDSGLWLKNTANGAIRQLSTDLYVYGFKHTDYNWEAIGQLEHNGNAYSGEICYGGLDRWDDFKGGYCAFGWTLYPEGRYFEDSDGFGGEENDEVKIYVILNCNLEVVVPWQPMDVCAELQKIRSKT